MKIEDMVSGMHVRHRNGFGGTVDDVDSESFSIVWDNAGRITYPAKDAKDYRVD